ncbi:MAG TPA: hypothetical protein VNM22_21150 [Candidatus Limnocylindrales bacterium]|nr:hypothetical protein [Candidatus Limnocylindrales bacterium]
MLSQSAMGRVDRLDRKGNMQARRPHSQELIGEQAVNSLLE